MRSSTDSVSVTTVVAVDPETAFEVFTEEVDAWWKHGKRFRTGERGASRMRFEPGVGGRLLEIFDAAADPFVLGRITAWEPAKQLAFEMGGRDFGPGEKTEVDVRFEPADGGTRVTVEHRGWDAFPADHPVRHGLGTGGAFTSMMGVFWADLLVAHRARAEERN
ncbi:MAG: SRPBCC domain-containing protein [Proteobacteria bacterium]|nr:SRPBCC domain-containing protein [Pseudomonadota bacterium]